MADAMAAGAAGKPIPYADRDDSLYFYYTTTTLTANTDRPRRKRTNSTMSCKRNDGVDCAAKVAAAAAVGLDCPWK